MIKHSILLSAFLSVTLMASCDKDEADNDDYENYSEYASIEATNLTQQVKDSIDFYIATNHQNASIVEVEIDNQLIEVELNDKTELIFDLDGVFLRYDD